jgi:uncharacterized protein with HEPN domain
MNERAEQALTKIRKYISKATEYSKGYSYDNFVQDEKTTDACIFAISQIGELVRRCIDNEFRNQHPEIPWRNIVGMRNRIIHDYEGIKYTIVWKVIKNDLPGLDKQIEKLQKDERERTNAKDDLRAALSDLKQDKGRIKDTKDRER